MEPEWYQDNKSIQPRQLPQFEVGGHQIDREYRERAVKLIVSKLGIAVFVVLVFWGVFLLPSAFKATKNDFGKKKFDTANIKVENVQMQIHGRPQRLKKIKGFLFNNYAMGQKKGERKKNKDRFVYVVIDVSLSNQGTEEYSVNPYSFALNTAGTTYRTDLAIATFKGRMRQTTIDPNEEMRGFLVFQVPEQDRLRSLDIMGPTGPIASSNL